MPPARAARGPRRARSRASRRIPRCAGAASRRRYCQPRSPARLTSTRTNPESESRIARRSSDIGAGSVRAGPSRTHRRFTAFSQAGNARDNGHPAHAGTVAGHGGSARIGKRAGPLEIRPDEFMALLHGRPLEPHRARAGAADRARRAPGPHREPRGAVRASSGASRTASRTARSTSTSASCARSWREALPGRRLHPHALRLRLPPRPPLESGFHTFFTGGRHADNRLRGSLTASPPHMYRTQGEDPHEEAPRVRRLRRARPGCGRLWRRR